MGDNYVLVDGVPVEEPNVHRWARWFEEKRGESHLDDYVGKVRISTVFLGVDYRFMDNGPPILWETMVFGGKLDGHTERYSDMGGAYLTHYIMIEKVRELESGT